MIMKTMVIATTKLIVVDADEVKDSRRAAGSLKATPEAVREGELRP